MRTITWQRFLVAGALALAAVGVIVVFGSPVPLYYQPTWDGISYYRMAAGDAASIHFYYAGRLLHPLAVRFLSGQLHLPLIPAFYLVSWVALALFLLTVSIYLLLRAPSLLTAIPLLVCPTLITTFGNYYYQDLFHAALVALFLLAMAVNPYLSLFLIIPMQLTRESSSLLILVTIAVALYRREKSLAVSTIGVAGIGMLLVRHLAGQAFSNEHAIAMPIFYGLKVVYDFAQNFLGLIFWTNTTKTLHCGLSWAVNIPSWIHLGSVRQIGLCPTSSLYPLNTAATLLSSFGSLPVLAVFLWRYREPALSLDLDAIVALVYGVSALLISPVIGTWGFWEVRYVFYAWPLFWLALPVVIENHLGEFSWRDGLPIVGLIVISLWMPMLLRTYLSLQSSFVTTIALETIIWALTYGACNQLLHPARAPLASMALSKA